MDQRITRSFDEPKREGLTWLERWKGNDAGLILCWEIGKEIRLKNPELAERAEKGELPVLGWKGGVEKKILKGEKTGTLFYLAQWQGLRGDDLNINPSQEPEITCAKTGVKVKYTGDSRSMENLEQGISSVEFRSN